MTQSSRLRAQASLEMTAAMLGVLLLLFGAFKICLWTVERIVKRDESYNRSRVNAGSTPLDDRIRHKVGWDEAADHQPLKIFSEDQ